MRTTPTRCPSNRVNPTLPTGLLKGSFVHPATGKKVSINGVVLQKQNEARGFFLGTNKAGAFLLQGN